MLLLLWNLTEGFSVLFPRNTFRISFSFMNLGFWGFEKYSSFGGNSFVFFPMDVVCAVPGVALVNIRLLETGFCRRIEVEIVFPC